MKYVNREIKIDQLIAYFNQGKINLIPPFQRGTVWTLNLRKALLVNMLKARPIPALFLYKEASGSQFAYNILDGKQRLESLILFVGNKRPDMVVQNLENYFFQNKSRKQANFSVALDDNKPVSFAKLDESIVRSFREYAIPTIEIDLDDESASFDEIVSLFVDINQKGLKVTRFDIVKALNKDRLFRQVLDLIAIPQQRGSSRYYKSKKGGLFVPVLKRLNAIGRIQDNNSQVDRMWERLAELALFHRSGTHRKPAEVLQALINQAKSNKPLSGDELRRFRRVFEFVKNAYATHPELRTSKLATDLPQFYTLITTLLSTDLLETYVADLADRLSAISKAVTDGKATDTIKRTWIHDFNELSTKSTADPGRRKERCSLLARMVQAAGTRPT